MKSTDLVKILVDFFTHSIMKRDARILYKNVFSIVIYGKNAIMT